MANPRASRAEKQAKTRQDVLDAAATVFPRRGFHRTTVDQIAAHAGLSIGAVYSNFAGKAGLFLALYERQMDRWVSELRASVAAGETPDAQSRAAVAYWLRFYHEERDWFVLHMEFWAHVMREPELQPLYAAQFRRLRDATAELVGRAASDHGLSLPGTPDDIAMLLQAINRGLLVEAFADPAGVQPKALSEALPSLIAALSWVVPSS